MKVKTDDEIGARIARRRRERLAGDYAGCARLPDALSERIVEHLEPIRRDPARILELGSATGHLRKALANLYPRAQLISSDDCCNLLKRQPSKRWSRKPRGLLCTQTDRLPIASASVDMLVCNLALLRTARVAKTLSEWRRVLRHDAVVMVATLGPLSFKELVEAWSRLDGAFHLHDFPDMHELGDALVRAGFSDVVMDSERIRMEFDGLGELLRDLRTVSGGNTRPDRRRSLMTPRSLKRLEQHYLDIAPPPGCWATVEAVFAHGWVVERAGVVVALPKPIP